MVRRLITLVPLLFLIFITSTLITWVFLNRYFSLNAILQRRMRTILAPTAKTTKSEKQKSKKASITNANSLNMLKPLVRLFERSKQKPKQQKLALLLSQAGSPLKPAEFMAINVASVLFGIIITMLFRKPLFIFLGAGAGWMLPRLYLKRCFKKRQDAFCAALPQVLTMMANSLRAGFGFLQAMEVIAHDMKPPVSSEFERVLKEMQFGTDLEVSLEGMGTRIASDDLDLIITAMLINRQVGGNLSEILDTTANTLRERIAMRGQVKALTAQGRMSGIVISMLPFGIFAFLWLTNRPYISLLFTKPLGKLFIGMWLTGQALGTMMIRKITQIKF